VLECAVMSDPLSSRELAAFAAAVETGSVQGASEALDLTQSATTKRIQALERRLGVTLLTRGRHGVRPTEEGMALYPEARRGLDALAQAEQAVAGARAARPLRIAASHTIGEALLPTWLTAFRAELPGVHPRVDVVNSVGAIAAVREEGADVGFVEGLEPLGGLDTKVVARDRIVLVVAADHRWAHRRFVNPRELVRGRWISRESGSGMRAVAAAALAEVGVELEPDLSLASLEGGEALARGRRLRPDLRAGPGARPRRRPPRHAAPERRHDRALPDRDPPHRRSSPRASEAILELAPDGRVSMPPDRRPRRNTWSAVIDAAAVIETERLRLERWDERHTDLLVRLALMPAVMRFIGTGDPWPPLLAEDVARAERRHWEEHGFGWRAAVDRATGRGIGLVSLNYAGEGTAGLDPEEREIGWWLEPEAWGRGLGSEGAAALRDEAFQALEMPSIIARIQPPNAASIGVARALGMEFDFETTGRSGERLVVYRVDRP
jgi:DNA-binding transcriptional LysR family regulator